MKRSTFMVTVCNGYYGRARPCAPGRIRFLKWNSTFC
ncbi:hypothetical protein bas10_0058 [Escherichia phage IsaakIselin]|uniref:Uncharacterized protein n=1 Tax=Escherichia phage IsaakIselin TaxID=2851974 RepID=A0AAE8B180_9CAUD|nr:hypothetical protein bas10_0058 [Escherichia phage IsaakIselin]